jgi:CNT family concentrative nucleoside transporter
VAWGTGLQLLLGALVFLAPGGARAFLWLNDAVLQALVAAQEGQKFLFGPLALGPGQKTPDGFVSIGFILAFQALPIIIFAAALMGLLYYAGVMPLLIRGFAWLFTRLMRVSGAESLCAASNIFVGVESATAVRPYIPRMTRSELCTILTAGMATVASSTLGLYVLFLQKAFPTIAGHLISASIMSAPAAIVMSKLLLPEKEQPLTLGTDVRPTVDRESSAIEAVIGGAMAGVQMFIGVCALLIAFLGMIGLLDLVLAWVTGPWLKDPLTLRQVLGWLLAPVAWLLGVPWSDAVAGGALLGERLIATEVPAYQRLATLMAAPGRLAHPRTAVVMAYALCGFAHVASLAIFVGGTAALAPDRRKDLAAVGPRALLAATLACLMTGCVAGVFYHQGVIGLVRGG